MSEAASYENIRKIFVRFIKYAELFDICRKINDNNKLKNIKRNVSIIQDIDGNNIVIINDIRFKGKRSIDWKEVREYLKEFHASLLVRHSNDGKLYLYDVIDIKKETSNSLG